MFINEFFGKKKVETVAEGEDNCPPATQDIALNLENRKKAIDEYGYGPLNPALPNTKFWMHKVNEWNLDSADEAKQSLCGNCAAFDIRQNTLGCIAQGIDSSNPEDAASVIDAGDLGYCKFLKFKCASQRTCDAWVTGGPLTDEQGMAEAGSFSYGKPPRKGSVADLAAKKRKEQERGQQPVEPRDQRVGVARVRKDLAEGVMDQIKNIYMMLVSDTPMGTTKSEFLGHWQRIIQDELGKRIDIDTLAKLDDNFTNRYKSMSRRGDVGDWHREMGHDLEEGVAEDLEANQQRVGQLGPKAKHAKPGDLVGVDESTDSLAAMRRLSGLIK